MRYVAINNPGPESQLFIAEGPTPSYHSRQLLVKVAATAVNRADTLQRAGKYPPPPGASDILGLELSGEVVEVGKDVSHFKSGDRVYALVSGGAYAEFCAVEEALAEPLMPDWDYVTAAALPEALITAHATVFELAGLQKNQTLLMHGAGSGITSLAIPMAKTIQAKVITSVGNASRIQKARLLGADQILDYSQQDLEAVIAKDSVDCVVDFVGGDYLNKHLNVLKPLGRLVQIAFQKDRMASCDLALLTRKRLQILGFVLRTQSLAEKAVLWQKAHTLWQEPLAQGRIKPLVDSVFTLERVEEAHKRMLDKNQFGKIVVTI